MARLLAAFLVVMSWAPAVYAQSSPELAATAQRLAFHSAFWPNLHSVLWAEAWSRRPPGGEPSPSGVLPERLPGTVPEADRRIWEAAVAFYDREIADLHPLFDPQSAAIRRAVIESGPELTSTGLSPAHRAALIDAAAIYRRHLWPRHDRLNRAWIADVVAKVEALSPGVPDRLSALYGTAWFTRALRVDVVRVSSREGAFTSMTPAPGHITLSSSSPASQGWAAAEVVFHEASHLLFLPSVKAFTSEVERQKKNTREGPIETWNANVWHVALFYSTGEVVRQALRSRGTVYEPYLYATGMFERTWLRFKEPIETHWQAFVSGQAGRDEAITRVVAALK